jgi:NAD(P)-dependent dehydrogenase (short-subunit alcohol dehydrogenase family)
MTRLAGQHALVTGGGTGIGAATARKLAAEGALLTLVGRRAGPIETLAAELQGAGAVIADACDAEQARNAVARAREQRGPVSILVNNAGDAESMPFERMDAEAWRRSIAVNLDTLFHMTQAALPDLRAVPAGRIITIASTAGLKGYAYAVAYSAAKHGAIGFTRALAVELAKTSITVNAVCPGFTDTDLVARSIEAIAATSGRSPDQARADLVRFNPQGRLIAPEEVADTVLWLCLPESRSITGQAIAVAGGEVM